jgi:hypothetical protein
MDLALREHQLCPEIFDSGAGCLPRSRARRFALPRNFFEARGLAPFAMLSGRLPAKRGGDRR